MSKIVVRAKSTADYPDKEVPEYEFSAIGVGERFVGIEGDISDDDVFYIETLVAETQHMVMQSMFLPKKGTMYNFVGVIQFLWHGNEDKIRIVRVEGDIGEVPYDKNKTY